MKLKRSPRNVTGSVLKRGNLLPQTRVARERIAPYLGSRRKTRNFCDLTAFSKKVSQLRLRGFLRENIFLRHLAMPMHPLLPRGRDGPISAIYGGPQMNDKAQNIIWLKNAICAIIQ